MIEPTSSSSGGPVAAPPPSSRGKGDKGGEKFRALKAREAASKAAGQE